MESRAAASRVAVLVRRVDPKGRPGVDGIQKGRGYAARSGEAAPGAGAPAELVPHDNVLLEDAPNPMRRPAAGRCAWLGRPPQGDYQDAADSRHSSVRHTTNGTRSHGAIETGVSEGRRGKHSAHVARQDVSQSCLGAGDHVAPVLRRRPTAPFPR